MRKLLVYILKNSEIILFVYNLYYRLKNKKVFFLENERRQKLSIFDYQELSKPIPYYPLEKMRDSNYYGYAMALRKYAHLDKINAALEHGIYLANRIGTAQRYRTTRRVITMSNNRVESFKLHNLNKPILAIGPYIHYAEPLLSQEELAAMKQSLGKVLLVMPVHAAKGTPVFYNYQVLLDFIEKIKNEYDTVLVCIHFRDILNNIESAHIYEKKGYKIVCAGNEYDYNFARRLRSIIMLADYVVSNSHGTNTGFCTYLRKPQTIVYDKDIVKIHNSYTSEVKKIRDKQVREIEDAFTDYSPVITEYQLSVVEKYFGISLIKSPDKLREALNSINK